MDIRDIVNVEDANFRGTRVNKRNTLKRVWTPEQYFSSKNSIFFITINTNKTAQGLGMGNGALDWFSLATEAALDHWIQDNTDLGRRLKHDQVFQVLPMTNNEGGDEDPHINAGGYVPFEYGGQSIIDKVTYKWVVETGPNKHRLHVHVAMVVTHRAKLHIRKRYLKDKLLQIWNGGQFNMGIENPYINIRGRTVNNFTSIERYLESTDNTPWNR
jgi:hypothetical protein